MIIDIGDSFRPGASFRDSAYRLDEERDVLRHLSTEHQAQTADEQVIDLRIADPGRSMLSAWNCPNSPSLKFTSSPALTTI